MRYEMFDVDVVVVNAVLACVSLAVTLKSVHVDHFDYR